MILTVLDISATKSAMTYNNSANKKYDTIPLIKSISFDSFYRRIPFVKNVIDSIKVYEENIDKLISDELQLLKKDSVKRWDEKKLIIELLKNIKQYYKNSIENYSQLLYLSFGKIPKEKGKESGLYNFYLLKEEFFYLSAIIDNININILEIENPN
jgi:hypothetical protein